MAGSSLFALVAGIACSASPVPTLDEPVSVLGQCIMDGTVDQNHPAVVGIVVKQGWSAGLCTGSLITPNLVLTARHCVAQTDAVVKCSTSTFGSTHSASDFFITTEYDRPEEALATMNLSGTWYRADQVFVPGDRYICGSDIALIRLKGDGIPASVTTPIIPRVDSTVADGEIYTAIGFGATSESGSGSGRRRILEQLAVRCVGTCFAAVVNNEREWQGDRGVCQGDSGGPAIDSYGRLIGGVSRGGEGCGSPVYADIAAWADWLKQHATAAAEAGGFRVPGWASGVPTGPDIGGGGAAGSDGGQSGGSGAAGAGGSDPALAGPGEACERSGDCESGVCVFEDPLTLYCSQRCSAENTACPAGMTCDINKAACFMPGGFASVCTGNPDCRSQLCVSDNNGAYCSKPCASDAECPQPATCGVDVGACFLPYREATRNAGSSNSGCAVADALNADPTPPIPWVFGAGLLALALVRRRQPGA
jgi:hypothetical protein